MCSRNLKWGGKMVIYLVRHGETDFNTGVQRIRGRIPIPLNEAGKRHADEVGKALSTVKLDTIFYSEVERAKETAEGVHKYQPDATFLEEPLAIDIDWGEWSGKTYREAMSEEDEKLFWSNPNVMEIPKGETFYQVLDRIHRLMFKIRNSPDEKVCIVSHGAVLNLFLCYAMEAPLSRFWDFYGAACSLTELDYDKKTHHFKLVRFNDTHHLTK